jgi:hypothetical protein
MTEITFYHSKICPRCIAPRKLLKELEEEFPHLKIKRIGAISHFIRRELYTLPAVRIDDTILYSKEITREKILEKIQ